MAKHQEESSEQLDKALTEMDVLASSDKDVFRVDAETFRLKKVDFKLIENHKDAFDIEMMEERFTDYLLKYDYIVGDIGYDKLRLRGFYEDYRKGVPLDMKISNLEDYLVEYCNFGCPYFVFERIEKKKGDPESYFKRHKKSNQNKKGKHNKRRHPKKSNNKNNNKKQPQNNKKPKDFQVVKKEETGKKPPQQTTQTKKVEGNKEFKIRKKKDE
jgi:uncharacterized protein YutD